MKNLSVIISLIAVLFFANQAWAIKKCKDATGKWHYGDYAQQACAKSEVTTLDGQGVIKDVQEAVKTEEEQRIADEQKAIEDAELARIKAEQEQKSRILSSYETEADIDRQRDNQLNSVDGNIAVHKAYLKSMGPKISKMEGEAQAMNGAVKEAKQAEIAGAKKRVEEYSAELKKLQQQRKDIVARFENEKAIYRELTQKK